MTSTCAGHGEPLERSVAWTSEPMVRGPFATGYETPAVQAALDATGTTQAVVSLKTGTSTFAVAFVHQDAGAWTSEPVAIASYEPYRRLVAFGLDGAGNPHFTYERTEYARDGAGIWHAGTIPPISGLSEPHAPQRAAWIDADDAVVLVFGLNSGTDDYEVGVVEKSAAAWQPLRLLARDDRTYGVFPPFLPASCAPASTRAAGRTCSCGRPARGRGTWTRTSHSGVPAVTRRGRALPMTEAGALPAG